MLDHMDAYLRGDGTEFPAGPPEQYANEVVRILRPVNMWSEYGGSNYRLHISPVPGTMLVLDVTRDLASIGALVDAVSEAMST